jgi:hypothetical protein
MYTAVFVSCSAANLLSVKCTVLTAKLLTFLGLCSSMKKDDGTTQVVAATASPPRATTNNYQRPEGQNVGNFLTERPASRVLNVPGGSSQIIFGTEEASPVKPAAKV